MQTMKAFQLLAPRQTVLADVPRPAAPADGQLLRTRCVSICSTDISFFEGHLFPSADPIILGHEYLGEVVEKGPEFTRPDIGIGDRYGKKINRCTLWNKTPSRVASYCCRGGVLLVYWFVR